jgi:O-6-methylguanine DNA methyltransferase
MGTPAPSRPPRLLRREIGTPLGPLLAGVVEPGETPNEPGGVCVLELGQPDRRERELDEIESHFSGRFESGQASPLLDDLEYQIAAYFAGDRRDFDLPLCTPGTRFQHDVWNTMQRIPYGHTVTYGELARTIGKEPTAARAVGAASGRNRVSIIIPCHRVVDLAYDPAIGGSAGLRGYGGGLENKRWLLDHERRIAGGPGLFEAALDGPIRGSR